MAQRVGRGIALLFHDRGSRRWVSGQQHAPAALYLWQRPAAYCTGGWVGPRAGLDFASTCIYSMNEEEFGGWGSGRMRHIWGDENCLKVFGGESRRRG